MPYADAQDAVTYRKQRWAAMSPEAKLQEKRRQREMSERFYSWMSEIKLSRGCDICDWKGTPNALHWHHRDPKFKTAHVTEFRSKENALAEMAKCDLLCANCHFVVEAVRKARRQLQLVF